MAAAALETTRPEAVSNAAPHMESPVAEGRADEADRADMVKLAGGYDAALNDLMGRHGGKLFRYLIRCVQNEDDAADLSQETFVRVYQHRSRFNPRRRFSSWLYAIASNLVRDHYRWRSRHQEVSLEAGSQDGGLGIAETLREPKLLPDEKLQAEEHAAAVRQAVAALPVELRMPLIFTEYEDRSQAETAEILGCTTKAVETRIYRARERLRASLNQLLA